MNDKVFRKFLEHELAAGRELARNSDLLKLHPEPCEIPQRFLARYRAKGLVQTPRGIEETDRCDIMIWFPDDYLRRADPTQILTYLGPSPRPWHPNIRPPFVCVHPRPGTGLVEILYLCFEVWTWRLYATSDEGLNHAASQWARSQPGSRFPIDPRPLKRRVLNLDVRTSEGQKP
jgi:hypothetical protein